MPGFTSQWGNILLLRFFSSLMIQKNLQNLSNHVPNTEKLHCDAYNVQLVNENQADLNVPFIVYVARNPCLVFELSDVM